MRTFPRRKDGRTPMGFSAKPLSGFVRDLWSRARSPPAVPASRLVGHGAPGPLDLPGPLARLDAAVELSVRTFGRDATITATGLTDVAEYALAVRDRFVVHSVRAGAARLARETTLPIVPDRCPIALETPLLLEARHADRGECLVGDITGIAVHPQPDNIHGACLRVIVRAVPDKLLVFRWVPRWTGEDVEGTVDPAGLVGMMGFPTAQPTGVTAARFLLVFALLLEASRSPLEARGEEADGDTGDTGGATGHKGPKGGPRPPTAPMGPSGPNAPAGIATTRHVYLSRDFERERADALAQRARASAQTNAQGSAPRSDLVPVPAMVGGHLHRYQVGPRTEGRRAWLFVSPYRSTRLAGPRSTVDVHRARGDKT